MRTVTVHPVFDAFYYWFYIQGIIEALRAIERPFLLRPFSPHPIQLSGFRHARPGRTAGHYRRL